MINFITITPLHILLIRRDCDLTDLIFAIMNSLKKEEVLRTSCTNRFRIKYHKTSKCHVKYNFTNLKKSKRTYRDTAPNYGAGLSTKRS